MLKRILDWFRRPRIVIRREDLPTDLVSDDDDGFDAYRAAMAREVMRTGQMMIGHVDERGDLHIEPVEPDEPC